MDEKGFVKDETPYLVFACTNCQQHSYVKTTQKAKKCLRCGCSFQVKSLLSTGIIVKGVTAALNTIKRLQNQLGTPEFHTSQEFVIATKKESLNESNLKQKMEVDSEERFYLNFIKLLKELSQKYPSFPLYMIELLAPDYDIPKKDVAQLVNLCIATKKLIKVQENQYRLQKT